MDKTSCYSYFAVCSGGVIENGAGFIAHANSDFDPDYITEKLNINPYETKRKGTPRKNGHGTYSFSAWTACFQAEPVLDAEEQCNIIVRRLKNKIPLLLEIKDEFDVTYCINIVPHIYNEETPALVINKEVIEFCYLTGTEIGIDLFVYDKEL